MSVRPGPARPVLALLAALLSAAAVAALAHFSVSTASGQRFDQLVLSGARADGGPISQWSVGALASVQMPVIAGVLALAALLTLIRRRAGFLVPLSVLVIGANLTTQALKLAVARDALGPGIEITPNSFPSGHTTLAATAAAAVLLASGPLRPLIAILATVWCTGTGIGTVVAGWHRPSDVVGGILVVAAWTFLALGIDGLRARRMIGRATPTTGRGRRRARPATGRAEMVIAGLLVLGGLGALAIGATVLRDLGLPLQLDDIAQQTSAYLATITLIGGGTALWMALVIVLRMPEVPRSTRGERVP